MYICTFDGFFSSAQSITCERNESAPSSGLQSELKADEADSAADRLSFRDDWEGDRDRAPIPEGVPPLGDEDSEVPEL